jgi:hypothetical protein
MAQYQRLIHDYLDGTIEPYMEEMLFDELARDNTLRREFHEQMAIHRSASSDMASISTPGDLGNQVFATLGISAVPVSDVRLPLTARRSFKTFTSLFAGAFTVMLVYFLTAQLGDSPKVVKTAADVKIPQEKIAENPVQIASNSEGENLLKETSQNVFSTNNSFKNIALKPNSNGDFKAEKSTENVQPDFLQHTFNGISSVNALPSDSYSLKTGTQTPLSTQSLPDFINSLLKTYPANVEVNFASTDLKKVNWTGTFLYDLSPADKFGLEAGYENFQQTITQSVNGTITKDTKLTPNVTVGLVYRRLIPEFSPFKSIVPFAQVYGGAATNGGITPLVKGKAGLVILPVDRVQLNFGYEAAIAPGSSRYNSRFQFFAGLGLGF